MSKQAKHRKYLGPLNADLEKSLNAVRLDKLEIRSCPICETPNKTGDVCPECLTDGEVIP